LSSRPVRKQARTDHQPESWPIVDAAMGLLTLPHGTIMDSKSRSALSKIDAGRQRQPPQGE
jgi:hypothetical protein